MRTLLRFLYGYENMDYYKKNGAVIGVRGRA